MWKWIVSALFSKREWLLLSCGRCGKGVGWFREGSMRDEPYVICMACRVKETVGS